MRFAPIRRALSAGVIALLVLSGCSDGDSGGGDAEEPGGADDSEKVAGGNPFVQDLWVYESLRTADAVGEVVDHTDAIVEHVSQLDAGDPVDLIPGMTFAPILDVDAHIKGPDGEPRPDASAVAGLVRSEIGTAFAVLGTVAADGDRQLGHEDSVFVDMTFLGDAIGLGDVVSADLVLVQLLPTDDPVEAGHDPLDLAAHRSGVQALQYTADEDGDVAVITRQLGTIVSGSTGPELPVKSSNDMLDGFRDGIKKCRTSGLRCVSNFFREFGDGATSNFEQNMDQLDPDPLPPPPPPCIDPPCGRSTGDPHLTTFDGYYYGMQAVGEFVLARHETDAVEVQIRTSAVNEQVSRVDRVAVGIGDERILIGAHDVVAGAEVLDDGAATVAGAGYTLTHLPARTVIETDDGHIVTVQRHSRGHLDVIIAPGADGSWVGLLGDADGDQANDLVDRSGSNIGLDPSFDDLYGILVMSWRLTDAESLFDYADGESTNTFTDMAMPGVPVTVASLDDASRTVAEAACQLVGIESARVLDQCVIDFAMTGDIEYLRSARLNDGLEAVTSSNPSTDPDAWSVSGENVLGVGGTRGSATHECPPAVGDELPSLYGDGIYHLGSSVCAAAVHSGEITAEDGGVVTITTTRLDDGVTSGGVDRNGFTSRGWSGPAPGFVVAAA